MYFGSKTELPLHSHCGRNWLPPAGPLQAVTEKLLSWALCRSPTLTLTLALNAVSPNSLTEHSIPTATYFIANPACQHDTLLDTKDMWCGTVRDEYSQPANISEIVYLQGTPTTQMCKESKMRNTWIIV